MEISLGFENPQSTKNYLAFSSHYIEAFMIDQTNASIKSLLLLDHEVRRMSRGYRLPWRECQKCKRQRGYHMYYENEGANGEKYRGRLMECIPCGHKWYEYDHPDYSADLEIELAQSSITTVRGNEE